MHGRIMALLFSRSAALGVPQWAGLSGTVFKPMPDWLLWTLLWLSNILVAFARGGKAAVIAPLGSLYPIVSVPIAVLLLREKVGVREASGILCALVSVAALSWESAPPKSEPAHTKS